MSKFNKDDLSHFDIEYYKELKRIEIFEKLMACFRKQAREEGLTQKALAEKLKKDKARISKWLKGPGNLTIDVMHELCLGMGHDMTYSLSPLKPDDQCEVYYLDDKKRDASRVQSALAYTYELR